MSSSPSLLTTAAALAVAAPAAHAATDTVVATTAKPTPLAAAAATSSTARGTASSTASPSSAATRSTSPARPSRSSSTSTATSPSIRATASSTRSTSAPARSATCAPTARSPARSRPAASCTPPSSAIYVRAHGVTKRVANKEALSLDSRNSRFTFSGSREWSHEPWLATQTALEPPHPRAGRRRLAGFLDTLNPTFSGNAIYWMLCRVGEKQPTARSTASTGQARPRRARRDVHDPGRGAAASPMTAAARTTRSGPRSTR